MGKKKTTSEIQFGNVYFSNTDAYEKLDEEEFEIVKDGVKTTIICKFHKGYLITFSSKSDPVEEEVDSKPTKIKEPKDRFVVKRGRIIKRK